MLADGGGPVLRPKLLMTRKSGSISQRNDATSINNRRGMSRRAKRNASHRNRQASRMLVRESSVINPSPTTTQRSNLP